MKPRYKLTEAERPVVKEQMRAIMIEMARQRQTITYSEVALRLSVYLHPRSFVFSHLLREIGREEEDAGRGVLPSVVVRKSNGMPGGGFFRWVGQAGRELDDTLMEQIWRDELEIVFDYWHNQPESNASSTDG